MTNTRHYLVLGIIVVVCAGFTALVVHWMLTNSDWFHRLSPAQLKTQSIPQGTIPTPVISISLAQDASGQYILPTSDPRNPLALGPQTVGGHTACERLDNLKLCLQEKQSTLAALLTSPIASPSAGLNDACGVILNAVADMRPATYALGCIW